MASRWIIGPQSGRLQNSATTPPNLADIIPGYSDDIISVCDDGYGSMLDIGGAQKQQSRSAGELNKIGPAVPRKPSYFKQKSADGRVEKNAGDLPLPPRGIRRTSENLPCVKPRRTTRSLSETAVKGQKMERRPELPPKPPVVGVPDASRKYEAAMLQSTVLDLRQENEHLRTQLSHYGQTVRQCTFEKQKLQADLKSYKDELETALAEAAKTKEPPTNWDPDDGSLQSYLKKMRERKTEFRRLDGEVDCLEERKVELKRILISMQRDYDNTRRNHSVKLKELQDTETAHRKLVSQMEDHEAHMKLKELCKRHEEKIAALTEEKQKSKADLRKCKDTRSEELLSKDAQAKNHMKLISKLHEHNISLIQELSEVSKPTSRPEVTGKGPEKAQGTARVAELGKLYESVCKENVTLKKTKVMLSELSAVLTSEKDKLEKENEKLREATAVHATTQQEQSEIEVCYEEWRSYSLELEEVVKELERQQKGSFACLKELKDRLEQLRKDNSSLNTVNKMLNASIIEFTKEIEKENQKKLRMEAEFDAEVTRLNEQLQVANDKTKVGPSSVMEELSRYRITSYQPLKGDSFSAAGSYGSVHRVQVNNIPCIAKRIHDILVGREREEAVSKDQKQAIKLRFHRECVLLSRMRHPNIVQFMGVCYPNQDPLDLTLIMEFLPMDVEKCLQKYPNLPLPIKLSILLDVSYGLLHLHSASIIHRDLTAANVLLTPDMRAKITDLGISKILEKYPQQSTKKTTLPGAIGYMPPEALWEQPLNTKKLDIFSFGVLALYVAIQVYPEFYELKGNESSNVQIKKRFSWIEMLPGKRCRCLHDVIIQCLQDKAAQRPTTERLNLTLKQLSQDHPREITDIMHLAV